MSKPISNLAFRKGLEASKVDNDTIEKLVANAVANGIVSPTSRVGKLEFAPQEVKDAWAKFQEVAKRNLVDWNESLPTGQEISKVSLNCNK